ncbi:hypothetical protein RFI_25619 [Reticulomyxa filosa]|uniref:ubiquitinyl hydrolase 1 n=1 Tax=Reticulomyxa filosa TaxID=46433 RepID=X6MDL4_RETFI|nr:hypothetical protein RFI_25619 [Reticulomyxa filosa]|eukprot:ETO11756.1 hypothetical protein RFI_25619 [Reticulomyxa filosa]
MFIIHINKQKVSSLSLEQSDLGDCFQGFILNIPKKKFSVFKGRHWLTIRKCGDVWWNLDSSNDSPQVMSGDEVLTFILTAITDSGALMIVRKNNVTKNKEEKVTKEETDKKVDVITEKK